MVIQMPVAGQAVLPAVSEGRADQADQQDTLQGDRHVRLQTLQGKQKERVGNLPVSGSSVEMEHTEFPSTESDHKSVSIGIVYSDGEKHSPS